MRIVFRVNYRTVPGQSLHLRLALIETASGMRIEREQAMFWRDEWHWETTVDSGGPLRVEYAYVLRDERNAMKLEEWGGPRIAELEELGGGTRLLLDTWCSAGTVDHVYETSFFENRSHPHEIAPRTGRGNHLFRLRMAMVPDGVQPCLIGNLEPLGGWRWHDAVPLSETAENSWETSLHLSAEHRLEYKYGLRCRTSQRMLEIEEGDNRILESRDDDTDHLRVVINDEGYRRPQTALFRGAGVAVPVFSLRSNASGGIGEFADLIAFGDWAAAVGLKLLQILPVNDTTSSHDWSDSYPYSAISVHALHPAYLRIEDLSYQPDAAEYQEWAHAKHELNQLDSVDHVQVMRAKQRITMAVFRANETAIRNDPGYRRFLDDNASWLFPYAAFCVLRDQFGTADFTHWGEWSSYDSAKVTELAGTGGTIHIWLQYELHLQLSDASLHLRSIGVALKGDLPIGIDRHSADAWSLPHLFDRGSQAGAPPDAFAIKGQNWGFPTYNWEEMQRDGYAWWRGRFVHLARYFDAFRIDHILGFFRIWQVPWHHVEGIMGWFEPATPVHLAEFRGRGIAFDRARFCDPYIREPHLRERFGGLTEEVVREFFEAGDLKTFRLQEHVATQRQIVALFADDPRAEVIRDGLLDCVAEVLFHEVPGSQRTLFHPRADMESTRSFLELDEETRRKLKALADDYFYRRQDAKWQATGYEKLAAMRRASRMLLCGEDLGMVPACVPGVMCELGILSLEIQRMPKTSGTAFSNPAHAPYLSVVSPGTHDMDTLRGWWRAGGEEINRFAWEALGVAFPAAELSGDLAATIIAQHLESPAMWAVFSIQDLLAMDETIRHHDPNAERINVPAIMPFYWRYRLHLTTADLASASLLNERIHTMITAARR
ncbi:MAG: 4-alpha-glucanotransferase [Verrucomicrobiota bacterium]